MRPPPVKAPVLTALAQHPVLTTRALWRLTKVERRRLLSCLGELVEDGLVDALDPSPRGSHVELSDHDERRWRLRANEETPSAA